MGDTAFVLRVLTTNHVRDNANLEAKYSGRGGLATLTVYGSLLYKNMLDLTIPARNLHAVESTYEHGLNSVTEAPKRPSFPNTRKRLVWNAWEARAL